MFVTVVGRAAHMYTELREEVHNLARLRDACLEKVEICK